LVPLAGLFGSAEVEAKLATTLGGLDARVIAGGGTWFGTGTRAPYLLEPAGRSIGRASHNAIVQDLVAFWKSVGAEDIRLNQAMIGPAGTKIGSNRPDLQLTFAGRRVYIEIDAVPGRSAIHQATIRARDPGAIFIGILEK
jgi:hypothetical protein